MKTSKFVSENAIELEYIFQKSNAGSKALIVAFPGPAGVVRGGEWGYLFTIRRISDVNVLFLRSNAEYTKSRMTLCNGKPLIDEAIYDLVDKVSEEQDIEQIIAIGTSMGGYASLYYGIKYNWDIISGAPPYTFSNHSSESIIYATGESGVSGKEKMNRLLYSVMESYGREKYNKKCLVIWGEGEQYWKNESEGPQMLRDMEKFKIKYEYKLYPFSDHQTICDLFPLVLEANLNYYLGLADNPLNIDETLASPKGRLYDDIRKVCKSILLRKQCEKRMIPNLEIQKNIIFGSRDDKIALRNYVYVKSGWLWDVENYDNKKWEGFDEPIKFSNFWDVRQINRNRHMLSFYFQSTLLRWYKRHPETKVLDWLLDNFFEYMRNLKVFPNIYMEPYDFLIHILYLIELQKISKNKLSEQYSEWFLHEIDKSLNLMVDNMERPVPIQWQYKLVLGLLIIAVYYRNCESVYETLYAAALDMLNALNEYHFDKNGCCISEQLNMQDYIYGEIKNIMDFISANKMEVNKSFHKVKRTYGRVEDFVKHIRQPNDIMPPVGHTAVGQMCRSRWTVPRISCNFIKRTSNIAFLEDDKSLSYITINGGANTHSNRKHCDLLSFTWYYDGAQIFYDAGGIGQKHNLEEYANSSIAHNAFICDDMNYVIPEYSDWTTMDVEIEEHEDYVVIPTSHYLIEGVNLKRKFFWIKPNILILIDEGKADRNRKFSQNFLLGDFEIDKEVPSKIYITASNDIDGYILQHWEKENIELEEYRGMNKVEEEVNPRGTIIENWRIPRRGLNLAYSKEGLEIKFVTSIELHSSKHTFEEQNLQSVNFDSEGNLIVVLGDGKILFDNKD
ncbi:heparinase II/III domain-containing protein [Selenomonas sp. KH1T6]|uniref:heparinase II/III domain-containing protein n=1 Tax=Selenomonas sp. KH1T6 TaxID=3158784 RepID=UPI0008A7CA0A|nr:Heparinase II/III-like protein [Selenomonas ruminantium]